MTDIGILTCSNATQHVGCSSFGCLGAAYDREGAFAQYPDGVRIKGIINCAGCPGTHGHGKILKRVNALVASGVQAIHMSNCMVGGCPFIGKYENVIKEAHPGVEIRRGTHPQPPAEMFEKIRQQVGDQLVAQGRTIPEIAMSVINA
jgi:predicted metal-binding protein